MLTLKRVNLSELCDKLLPETYLDCYILNRNDEFAKDRNFPSMLVLPGGGYAFTSQREGEPIALRFASYGFSSFVLWYPVTQKFHDDLTPPHPLIEAIFALSYIQEHAEEYNLDPDMISAIGFSAGGHLCGTLAAYHNSQEYLDMLNIQKTKLYSIVLGYPVITSHPDYTDIDTMFKVTFNQPDKLEYNSVEKHVTKDFPRTFIWTTKEDKSVHPMNSYLMEEALKAAGVDYEAHYYEKGKHGMSLTGYAVNSDDMCMSPIWTNPRKDVRTWVDLATDFILKDKYCKEDNK